MESGDIHRCYKPLCQFIHRILDFAVQIRAAVVDVFGAGNDRRRSRRTPLAAASSEHVAEGAERAFPARVGTESIGKKAGIAGHAAHF